MPEQQAAAQQEAWTDLVERALFEKDPAARAQRFRDAKKAIQVRLNELAVEKEMLDEALKKLLTRRKPQLPGMPPPPAPK
jgi:hypothetical protein